MKNHILKIQCKSKLNLHLLHMNIYPIILFDIYIYIYIYILYYIIYIYIYTYTYDGIQEKKLTLIL